MRIEYRKKYPYYGKYKIKFSIGFNFHQTQDERRERAKDVRDYLDNFWKQFDDFKWSNSWNVYIKDDVVFDAIIQEFPEDIGYVYRPAPGYENLTGLSPLQKRILWYDKFPYKFLVKTGNRRNSYEYDNWCSSNIGSDYRKSAGRQSASFYFMNAFDAMAFKLKFSDKIIESQVANNTKAADILKARMEQTIREYEEYLEGENLNDSQ